MTQPSWCSRAAPAEPLAGTAPTQTHWLFVEAPGSWGRDALATSSLDAAQRASLAGLPGHWRVVLVRRPDRPLRRQSDRMVWLSMPDAVRGWRLPVSAPLHPAHLGPGDPVADEVLFVCTNGARDRCCAVSGRALFDAVSDPRVWECSHLGGHRFAPTGVRLADRMVFGRLDPPAVRGILDGGTPIDHVRGPAGWAPQVQAAAVAAWRRGRVCAICGATCADGVVELALTDGSQWRVEVESVGTADRQLSCGAVPEPGWALVDRGAAPIVGAP